MVQYPSNPAVVVVGAGAAGIGASLGLTQLAVPHIVLEAKQRVGGRAYSEDSSLGHLWDHGAHWFHSADTNILRKLALKIGHGHDEEDRNTVSLRFSGGKWHRMDHDNDWVWQQLDSIPEHGVAGPDKSAKAILDAAHPLYPVVQAWCQLIYSGDPETISCQDAAAYSDSHVNIPVRDGYGALIKRMAQRLPIKLNSPVRAISVTSHSVRVLTGDGEIEAKCCIVAVPARSFEHGGINFTPGLPYPLQEAFHDVPMGYGEKIGIAFDRRVFDGLGANYGTIFEPVERDEKAFMFELHPFGRPVAVCHVGGSFARELVAAGQEAMTGLALEKLILAFGSGIRQRVVRRAVTNWTNDRFIGGAYSCAKPGKAESRVHFRDPVHERILLAGEHTHPHYFATAHGAYLTGIEAASKAAALAGIAKGEIDPLWLAGAD
jgi:monoamine oxidase